MHWLSRISYNSLSWSRLEHFRNVSIRLAQSSTMKQENIMNVFDRRAKKMQKNRTASLDDYYVYEYIKEEVGYRVADRICDIKRSFNVAVDLGCGRGHVSKNIYSDMVGTLFQCDMADKVLMQSSTSPEVPTCKLIADEEHFPFKDNSLDLVVSSLSLHWVNDLPGCLRQVFKALRNDGVFIGSMFGGDTLYELRVSLQKAEIEKEGGFAPHISPFTDVADLGDLLNRAGYTMLTIDTDELVIAYPSMKELMYDLKGMGENNCAWNRKPMMHRETMKLASTIYKDMYGLEKGVPATFQIIYFIGWKPDKSQPKPLERGTGEFSLKDIDRLDQLVKSVKEVKDSDKKSENATDNIDSTSSTKR